MQTGRRLQRLIDPEDGDLAGVCAAITPDGTRAFVGGSFYRRFVVWNVEQARHLDTWGGGPDALHEEGSVYSMQMSADGKSLLLQRYDYSELCSVATGKRLRMLYRNPDPNTPVRNTVLSPNSRYVLVDDGEEVVLSEIASGRVLHRFLYYPVSGHGLRHLEFSPDGKRIVGIGIPGITVPLGETIIMWNTDTGKRLFHLDLAGDENVNFATFTPDGKQLVAAGNYIHVFDLATHREVRRFPDTKQIYGKLLITPDGQSLISLGADVELWRLATGERVPFWIQPTDP